jgi:hypothetical protein
MKAPVRSVTSFARPPYQGSHTFADIAAARPAGGYANTALAGHDLLPPRVRLTGRGPGYNSQVNENMARPQAGYPGIGGQYLRIRTLLVGGADWLARRRRCSPAGGSGAGSATHRGSGMYLEDLGPKGPDAPTGGGVRVDGRRRAAHGALVRVDDAAGVPVGRPAASLLRHGCARLAERIRVSAGVTAGDATSEQRAVTRTPWLGLLLWFCACAGLFVSLIMRPDDPERGHRVVAGNAAQVPIAGHPYPVSTLTEQASEVSLIASPRLPPRWAPD